MHHPSPLDRAPRPETFPTQRPPGRRTQVEALFDAAVDLDPTARRALLDARCAGQPSLRREVSRLLAYAQPTTVDPGQTRDSRRGWSPSQVVRAVEASRFEPPDWMRPGTSIGHYELIRQLGVGGMSTVFLARDTQLGRRVAMKFLHRADHGFENEARVTARCEHPHIVRIYGLGAWRGCPFMVLEYMPGRTLRRVLAEHAERAGVDGDGGLPLRQVCEIMLPVARALEAAHSQGVVHCDLKPENIMLGDDGTAKVLDFGIARLVESAPRPGAVVGTPAYMSPEQLRGEALDHRTDLWSMGVMLFEMLTGRQPFGDLEAQLDALLEPGGARPIETADVAQLDRLEPLVRACLEPGQDDRPDSASVLVEGLSDPRQRRLTPLDEAHVFAGLAPFQADDAACFFGRDAEVEAVVGRLRREPRLVIIGPSGVGKSSLVRAGVGPALAAEGWQILVVRPGTRPLVALSRLLAEVDPPPARVPAASTLAAQRGRFGHVLRQAARTRRARILVVIDQLEEVFADAVDPAARRAFFGCLDGAADEPSTPLRVVATLRDDFLHRLLAETHAPGIARQVFALAPPTRDGLRAALVAPVEAAGYRFEAPALVDEIIDGLRDSGTPLPLLQFVAERMWASRDRQRRLVTRTGYAALGGLDGALAEHADRVVDGLPRRDHALVRRLFGFLVTPGRTRHRLRLDDPSALGGDQRRLDRVVAVLVEGRLLDVHVDADGGRWVELVHESLITRWPRLQAWLNEADGDAVFEARVRAAAAQWRRAERSSGLVWRDRDARAAMRWSRRHAGTGIRARLGEDGAAYLEAVVRGARARRRRAQLAVGLALVGLLGATFTLARLRADADSAARQAANWARLSVARNLENDPTTMLAVLREVEGDPPPTWSRLVRRALEQNPARAVLQHPEVVTSAIWAPGGAHIATACGDESIRLWRPDGLEPERTLPAHMVARLRFDRTGRRLVSAGKDGTARIWRLDDDAPPTVLTHPAMVYQAVFDADGGRLATAAFDGKARVWGPDGVESAALDHGVMPDGGPTRVYGVGFAENGRRLVTVAWDGRLRFWSLESGELSTTVDAHDGKPAVSLDLAPDGRIVTGGYDEHVRVWAPDGAPVLGVALDAPVNAVRFDSERDRVIAGCTDGSVWAVGARSGARTRVGQHVGQVHDVDVAADGRVLSASFDGSARLWSSDAPRQRRLTRHTDAIVAVAVSADGQTLVTIGDDKALRVGPLDGSSPARTLYTGKGRLSALALHPGGDVVAVADAERGIVRARSDGAGPATVIPMPETWLSGLAFSVDGELMATDMAGRVWRWPSAGAAAPRLVGRHPDRALAIAADPHGRFVATGGADESVRLWPVAPGLGPLRLGGHPSKVTAVAVDRSGRLVAAGTLRGTWIWSVDARPPTRRVLAQESEVAAIAFGPRGDSVATVAADGTLRIWPVGGGEPVVLYQDSRLTAVAFTPDGRSIVVGAEDGDVRVLRDLAVLEPRDLWRMTYCLTPAKRREILGVSAAEAIADHALCRQKAAAARAAGDHRSRAARPGAGRTR